MLKFLVLLLMQVTVFSSVTALTIIAVKHIFKCRIPPRISMALWIVLLVRLLCPVFPESQISIYNVVPAGRDIMYTLTNDVDEELSVRKAEHIDKINPYIIHTATNDNKITADAAENVKETDSAQTVGEYITDVVSSENATEPSNGFADKLNMILIAVYLSGIAVSLSVNMLIYFKAKKRALFYSCPCNDERLLRIFRETSAKLGIKKKLPSLRCGSSSMLVGCISPAVIYKDGMYISDREATMLFTHELTHYKYADNPLLIFSTVVTCMFWYNPLIWLVRYMLREDIEVLCDSRALCYCGIAKTEYAMMLCKCSAFGELTEAGGCHMSTTGRHLKTRLRSIALNKGKRLLPNIVSVMLCVSIVLICLTNPIVSQNIEYNEYIKNYSALTGEDERALGLDYKVTVSEYLNEVAVIMANEFGEGFHTRFGGGSLEKFKRICSTSEFVSTDLTAFVKELRTDEALTNKNCAVINKCIVSLITKNSRVYNYADIDALPSVIAADDMRIITSKLSAEDAKTLLSCYNLGVPGADVQFDYYYTDAMMELILNRIGDTWAREKFSSFYQEVPASSAYSSLLPAEVSEKLKGLRNAKSLYVCTPTITEVEEATLRKIIGAAVAGQRDDVYYLKSYEDGWVVENVAAIFESAGYTSDMMLRGYSEIVQTQYFLYDAKSCNVITQSEYNKLCIGIGTLGLNVSIDEMYEQIPGSNLYKLVMGQSREFGALTSYMNRIVFPTLRRHVVDGVKINGVVDDSVAAAVYSMYDLGLIDSFNNSIDLSSNLSPAKSLYYAYKLVCSMSNVHP